MFSEAKRICLKLDKFCYVGVLSACGQIGDLELGKIIHGLAIVCGLCRLVFVTNLLINMYCKCGKVDQGRLLFKSFDELDNVSWNSLIAGHVKIGEYEEMLKILRKMHHTGLSLNAFTLGSALNSCYANLNNMIKGGIW